MRFEFLVQGSAPDPYLVTVHRVGTNVTATCTCPAGKVGQYCKHRFAILRGDDSGESSANAEEVRNVAGLLAGSDIAHALSHLQRCESDLESAKERVTAAKKALARAMQD